MTIKIKSTHPDSQGPVVVIDRAAFDPAVHELADGESLGAAPAGREPTLAELLATRDTLVRRERELDDQSEHLTEKVRANDAEFQRLIDIAAKLASDREAFEAAKFAPVPPAEPDLSALTKEQLQAALDERGIKYLAAANKAELQALLVGA